MRRGDLPSLVTHSKDTCYFDGQCGFCRRSATILGSLDWLGRLEFIDQSTLPDDQLPVPREAALRGMPMRTRGGGSLVGFQAVRRAMVQTPLGFLPACFLYIPGPSHLATMIYEHIAANRRRDGCPLHS